MMARSQQLLVLAYICRVVIQLHVAKAAISSAHLPLEARDDGSQEEDFISTSYVLPNQIFNDGKPYYAGKDPISGQLDFNTKKTSGIEQAANEIFDPKEKIVLSQSTPNIHDFLNLPVKYSSSKFVYPLVSSSYANLKYQGNNKNYMTNKKPTLVEAPVTASPSPNYNQLYTLPITKLMAIPSSAPSPSTTSTTTTTTSKRPVTKVSTTTTKFVPTTASTTSSTTTTTNTTPIPTKRTTSTTTSTTTTTTTVKPPSSSSTTPALRTTTTRKKYIPTKKYSPATSSTTTSPTTQEPVNRYVSSTTVRPKLTPTTTSFTTKHPTPQASIFPKETATSLKMPVPTTSKPIVFTEDPAAPPAFSPIPTSTRIPNLDPADVYQTLGQKNVEQKFEQKPSMTLADIFNSLADEESALASNNQGNQGFDAQGNLIRPLSPSQPSPFAMQQQRPPQQTMHSTSATTKTPFGSPPQQHFQMQPHLQQPQHFQQKQSLQNQQRPLQPPFQQQQQQQHGQGQNVLSGSQENYSNEYVSYQVQQPNMMQYHPAPGAINNVVISPGQNSASFVLGSQQQVGLNAFGTVEKEQMFEKKPNVQYGTVISEDISTLTRPDVLPSASVTHEQNASNNPQISHGSFPSLTTNIPHSSNFHQNGNQMYTASIPTEPFTQRPVGLSTAPSNYPEQPPPPPSPYQQLPLIGTSKRPSLPQRPPQQSHLQDYQQHQQQQQQPNYEQSPVKLPSGPPSDKPAKSSTEENKQSNSDDTKDMLVSSNIRFPAADEHSEEFPSVSVAGGPPSGPQVNGHAQPLSLQQIQNSNPVVFPKTKDDERNQGLQQNEASSQYSENENNAADIQIQKQEVLTMNQHKQKLNFPQLPEHVTPSQNMEPPPRFPPAVPNTPPEHSEVQKRPHPNGPPPFSFSEYTRKPIPGISRPNPDRPLPNILPQFRPNAKISSGHPPPPLNYNTESGPMRIPGQNGQPPLRHNPGPQFAHRRQANPNQKHYPNNRIAEHPPGPPPPLHHPDANRRHYRLPPYGGQFVDRPYPRRPMPHLVRPIERHAPGAAASSDMYKTLPQPALMAPERMAAFEEEDLVINDPPQPVTPSKDKKMLDETKLEPVVTLQMLQSQKKPVTLSTDDNGSGEIQVPPLSESSDSSLKLEKDSSNGLYVVYPMKGSQESTSESKESLPAVAHVEAPSGSDYQNTPFSVVRDQPQEPILMVKNKKPQSLQQQTKAKLPKDKFPYPIEKPDPLYSELNVYNRVPGILIAPRIVNGAHDTGTVAPIAIAYTPTEPNPYRRVSPGGNGHKYSNPNVAAPIISEIRADSQTEKGLTHDFDIRGQNFENDFMAPFYPSVSLGAATNIPSNGWNILSSSTDNSVLQKNLINRADVGDYNALDTTTKADNFQPELQGGFKPIYPPGYTIDDVIDIDENQNQFLQQEDNNRPFALPSRMDPPRKAIPLSTTPSPTTTTRTTTSTSTTTTTSTTTLPPLTTTAKPKSVNETTATPTTKEVEAEKMVPSTTPILSTTSGSPTPTPTSKKKSAFETSLEALLFGDDDEYEDEARKEHSKIKSGPRSQVPRMGPRNIKLS